MKFGTEEVTKIIDEQGSTETASINYREGIPNTPMRRRYMFRERVYTREEEEQMYKDFSKELANKPERMDAAFLIEKTIEGGKGGFYYVVKCYTLLEY